MHPFPPSCLCIIVLHVAESSSICAFCIFFSVPLRLLTSTCTILQPLASSLRHIHLFLRTIHPICCHRDRHLCELCRSGHACGWLQKNSRLMPSPKAITCYATLSDSCSTLAQPLARPAVQHVRNPDPEPRIPTQPTFLQGRSLCQTSRRNGGRRVLVVHCYLGGLFSML